MLTGGPCPNCDGSGIVPALPRIRPSPVASADPRVPVRIGPRGSVPRAPNAP